MIGMDLNSFLILLAISVVVSYVLHYQLKYYVTLGSWSFASWISQDHGTRFAAENFWLPLQQRYSFVDTQTARADSGAYRVFRRRLCFPRLLVVIGLLTQGSQV